jgi:hypothetical protein
MKNIRADAKNAVRCFFGEEEFKSAFDDPMNTPRY